MTGPAHVDRPSHDEAERTIDGPGGPLTVRCALVPDARPESSTLSLTLTGEFGYGTADPVVTLIQDHLSAEHEVRRVELHGQAVEFCDSHGIAQLLRIKRVTACHRAGFRLVEPSRHMRRVLQLTGVLDLLATEPGGHGLPRAAADITDRAPVGPRTLHESA